MSDLLLDEDLRQFQSPANPLANVPAVVDQIDTQKCLVHAVICTDAVDGAGDIVEPGGCLVDYHRVNPVVMYHHGIGIGGPDAAGYILPIGKSEDANGGYGVSVTPNEVTAWTKFSQATPFAQQVFALFAEKILRGFSVNALPVPGTWKRIEDKPLPGGQRKPCYAYGQWFLKEYSATALPVNQEALTLEVQRAWIDRDALTVALQKGKIISEKFHKVLQRDLSPFMLSPKVQSQGVTIVKASVSDKGKKMSDEKERDDKPKDEDATKPNPRGDMDGDEGETEKDVEGNDGSEGEVEKADEMGGDLKPTPRAMIDAHQAIRDLRMILAQSESAIEDEMGIEGFGQLQDFLYQGEQICADVLTAKGVKNAPTAMDTEELRKSCMKSKTEAPKETADTGDIMKGCTWTAYRPSRIGVIKAGVSAKGEVQDPEVDPRKVKQLEAELRLLNRQLTRSKRPFANV